MLAVPPERFECYLVTYLTEAEVDALVAAPERTTWTGRRDHALSVLAIHTGLRISELAGLTCDDIVPGTGAHVHCVGKGRKERSTPLVPRTVADLRVWLAELQGAPSQTALPDCRRGASQSRRDRTPDRPPRIARRRAVSPPCGPNG